MRSGLRRWLGVLRLLRGDLVENKGLPRTIWCLLHPTTSNVVFLKLGCPRNSSIELAALWLPSKQGQVHSISEEVVYVTAVFLHNVSLRIAQEGCTTARVACNEQSIS